MTSSPETLADIVAEWNRERPDLDASPLLIVGGMARLSQAFEPHLRPPFAAVGLGNGDFDVLAALRRAGRPFVRTPGELSDSLLVTTGAVTKRLDRLESRDLIERSISGSDARGRLVTLTARGVELTDELIGLHLANEARLLAGLTAAERAQLAGLIERLAATTAALVD